MILGFNFVEHETLAGKMNYIQSWVIVHSRLYYHYSNNIYSDHRFDEVAKGLAELMFENKDIKKESRYGYVFEDDYDGSSGVGLFEALNDLHAKRLEKVAIYINKATK